MKKLPAKIYKEVVKNTPIASIDLVIKNANGKVLLGYRLNNPAEKMWFVPGGAILKNEPFKDAFKRITEDELGIPLQLKDATYIGLYEHIYKTNFTNNPDFGTHYVVNAFCIQLKQTNIELPKDQHSRYWWATKNEILTHKEVHQNTKNYFNNTPSFSN